MENGNAPATKQDISDLKELIGSFGVEFNGRLTTLDGRLTTLDGLLTTLDNRITEVRDELTEKMRDIETNILTGFHRYAKGIAHRLHGVETADSDIIGRLHQIEERLLELERRIRPHN